MQEAIHRSSKHSERLPKGDIMTSNRNVIDIVVRHLLQNESVTALDARVEAHGGAEEYAQQLVESDMAKFQAQLRRLIREGQERSAIDQLPIPGMDYATLPRAIAVNDPEAGIIVKPRHMCTLDEVTQEIAAMRRDVNTRDRVVGGYEATVKRLTELGYGSEEVMAEIEADLRAIDGGLS
jgi:hypothetical protein